MSNLRKSHSEVRRAKEDTAPAERLAAMRSGRSHGPIEAAELLRRHDIHVRSAHSVDANAPILFDEDQDPLRNLDFVLARIYSAIPASTDDSHETHISNERIGMGHGRSSSDITESTHSSNSIERPEFDLPTTLLTTNNCNNTSCSQSISGLSNCDDHSVHTHSTPSYREYLEIIPKTQCFNDAELIERLIIGYRVTKVL